ncbi:MAG: hypothetical protein HUK06_05670 [Bacteroidaceae bacterium]|nr:hypothetical protein [Bacteroidaceae bacterium]
MNIKYLSDIRNDDFIRGGEPATDELVLTQELKEALLDGIAMLDSREMTVVSALYGINCAAMTMQECADEMGLKRERVRQIRNKALRKLRKIIRNNY